MILIDEPLVLSHGFGCGVFAWVLRDTWWTRPWSGSGLLWTGRQRLLDFVEIPVYCALGPQKASVVLRKDAVALGAPNR